MAYMGFDALKNKLAGEKGIHNPGALAASIGRKKYGKANFQQHAAEGESMQHAEPMDADEKKAKAHAAFMKGAGY